VVQCWPKKKTRWEGEPKKFHLLSGDTEVVRDREDWGPGEGEGQGGFNYRLNRGEEVRLVRENTSWRTWGGVGGGKPKQIKKT